MNKPLEISMDEWKEIMEVPLIQERWNIESDTNPEDFAACFYGVKFDFIDRTRDYTGDLYILLDDDVKSRPIRLVRVGGGKLFAL
jgi:hypothetical protein